jgi:hypothetical protein
MIFTIELGKSRARAGWMWGFFLGWVGVLILACMSKRNGAPQQMRGHEREMRELEVRELEARVRLAELRQAGQEEKS